MLPIVVAQNLARNVGARPNERKSYALYRKRFLWRFARMRLRRLCFEIFALRLFFREPITNLHSAVADPTTEQV